MYKRIIFSLMSILFIPTFLFGVSTDNKTNNVIKRRHMKMHHTYRLPSEGSFEDIEVLNTSSGQWEKNSSREYDINRSNINTLLKDIVKRSREYHLENGAVFIIKSKKGLCRLDQVRVIVLDKDDNVKREHSCKKVFWFTNDVGQFYPSETRYKNLTQIVDSIKERTRKLDQLCNQVARQNEPSQKTVQDVIIKKTEVNYPGLNKEVTAGVPLTRVQKRMMIGVAVTGVALSSGALAYYYCTIFSK